MKETHQEEVFKKIYNAFKVGTFILLVGNIIGRLSTFTSIHGVQEGIRILFSNRATFTAIILAFFFGVYVFVESRLNIPVITALRLNIYYITLIYTIVIIGNVGEYPLWYAAYIIILASIFIPTVVEFILISFIALASAFLCIQMSGLWDVYFPSYISLLLGGAFAFYVRRANYNILHGLLKSLSQTEHANKELETAVENLNLVNVALEDSVSELNERDDTIRKMLYKDELTGLMSKYAFVEKLEEALKNNVEHITILHLDIDNFKNVNDAFGHNFGNLVLRELGDRIQGVLQKNQKICRYGNDEFIILTEEYNKEKIIQLVNRIQKAINEVLIVDAHRIFLTSSIGIAIKTNQSETSENLLRYADISLHESKKKGKDTYTIYGEKLEENFKDKISFQNHIRLGYKNNEFFLNYQPLVSAKSKEIVGYEALIRWTNSELGNVSPFKLITEAEEMGLMVKLGEWIVRQGMAFAKELNQKKKQNQYVSINISALQLIYGGFYDSMVSIVREMNIPPETICFEVTETALIEDIDDAIGIVKQLSNYGFKIALDDFGTGYSSLNYLKSFPIDVLKVDKSFVDYITQSSYDKCLVDAIIKIAKERAFSVIAEGVETKEQFDLLYEMDCDTIQGYLFSKPLMHEEAIHISGNKYVL